MITKMKKVTLLCLDEERGRAMESLRDLGVLHVELAGKVESEECAALSRQLASLEKAMVILSSAKAPAHGAPALEGSLSGTEISEKALRLFEASQDLQKRLESLSRDKERLAPWGDFSPKSVEALKEDGIRAMLCIGSSSDLKDVPEGVCVKIVRDDKGTLYCLMVSDKDFDPGAFKPASLPNSSLSEVCCEVDKCKGELEELSLELGFLAPGLPKLEMARAELEEKLEFAVNRDGMTKSGEIAYLRGYVPEDDEEPLRKAAMESGWALLIERPTLDDAVPTLLRNPKWLDISKPIFEFIGISPGYCEYDVSAFVLIFLTIFFGIIVGDAGYGMLFLIVALLCKFKFAGKESARLPLNLLVILSSSTIVWGLLTGSFFGIPNDRLPSFMRGVEKLARDENKDKYVQYICFLLAGMHLSGARLFKAIAGLKHSWRALGNLGWALFIWGNFFTAVELVVFKNSFPHFGFWLYGAGAVLILVTLDWADLGTSMNLPFAFIGSFVDVLSYIRLYAVGMAGAYLAAAFNNMGMMVFDAIKPSGIIALGVVGLLAVALIGHTLNIILALLGVLVHGIRLNTLEFSNQMELQWAGIKFKPFKKNLNANSK